MHSTSSSVVCRCSSCSIRFRRSSSARRRCSIRSDNLRFWNWSTLMSISSYHQYSQHTRCTIICIEITVTIVPSHSQQQKNQGTKYSLQTGTSERLSQGSTNWESYIRKGKQHKLVRIMLGEALMMQISWCLVESSMWMSLLAFLTPEQNPKHGTHGRISTNGGRAQHHFGPTLHGSWLSCSLHATNPNLVMICTGTGAAPFISEKKHWACQHHGTGYLWHVPAT